ncbi:MAG: hypothetical protein M5U19_21680 [Microthrixaceae bacterium]|nr:hypothetical protein [Microthrixaceae bacterium]
MSTPLTDPPASWFATTRPTDWRPAAPTPLPPCSHPIASSAPWPSTTTSSRPFSTASLCTATCDGGSPATTPDRHLGGIGYLFVRGMVGPGTPTVDGVPHGLAEWHPPAALIDDLSELLDGFTTTRSSATTRSAESRAEEARP